MELSPSVLTTNSGKVKNSFALKLDSGKPLSKRSTQRLAESLARVPGLFWFRSRCSSRSAPPPRPRGGQKGDGLLPFGLSLAALTGRLALLSPHAASCPNLIWRERRTLRRFGPEANLFEDLETLFRVYGESGTGKVRKYLHDEEEAEAHQQEPGTFTPWEEMPPDTDMLFYEGLHGAIVTETVNVAQHADLQQDAARDATHLYPYDMASDGSQRDGLVNSIRSDLRAINFMRCNSLNSLRCSCRLRGAPPFSIWQQFVVRLLLGNPFRCSPTNPNTL